LEEDRQDKGDKEELLGSECVREGWDGVGLSAVDNWVVVSRGGWGNGRRPGVGSCSCSCLWCLKRCRVDRGSICLERAVASCNISQPFSVRTQLGKRRTLR
jgi:hypothetical protein